ncbi:MAG: universal stress protein [Deltaproteobacteria bacterium]|nr:universal stress protein [Deltaproteobacteria bacterium]
MWKYLGLVNKNLVIAIPIMMILGFIFGIIFNAQFLKNLIVPFTFLMVYPMMVTLKIKKVFEGGDTKAQLLTQFINFGIVPFVAFGLGILFFREQPYMALGLLLAGLVPTSGMTISWTGFAKGNIEAAVKMTIIGLTLGSIATPFYVKFFMGANLEVNISAVMKQILFIVFIPMIAGYITQQFLMKKYGMKEFQRIWAPRFPALSTIGVIGIVFIAIALKSKAILSSPQLLIFILIPLTIIYGFNYFLSTFVGKMLLPRGDAIALVYGSVMRNLSIALAIAINAFGPQGSTAALVIAIAYIIQVQSAAWYVKFTDKLFGPITEEPVKPFTDPAIKTQEAVCEPSVIQDIKRILYATDLSETAGYAIRYACSIADKYKAKVTMLHVVPDKLEELSAYAGTDMAKIFKNENENFSKIDVENARSLMQNRIRIISSEALEAMPTCPVSEGDIVVKTGDFTDRIVSEAEEKKYDLVIIGTHGHGKLADAVIGSVARGVIAKCSKPVLVVPLPHTL